MNRFGAFLIHLGISLVIFAVLAALVVFVWYPDFFFTADGGWQGIRIIAAVDLVLGPLLTLVVFNRAKPRAELRRDLTMIGTFQFVCLVAGTYVVYSERPIALVYSDGYFVSMSADDYRAAGVAVPELSGFPGRSPKWVSVVLPEDPFAQSELRKSAWKSGTPLRALADLYQPFSIEHVDRDSDTLTPSDLSAENYTLPPSFRSVEAVRLVKFGTRYRFTYLGLDGEGNPVGVLDHNLLPVGGGRHL